MLAAVLAITVQAQPLTPVSAADLRSLLDGVVLEEVDSHSYDHTEIFLSDGRYRFSGRTRWTGRYTISTGVLCRGTDPGAVLPGAESIWCSRILSNDQGQLFWSAMNDPKGSRSAEIRFRPLPSDQ